ncbi:hypothetical protein ACLBWX_16600 [Methylobacterium sp. M6A4_1b]
METEYLVALMAGDYGTDAITLAAARAAAEAQVYLKRIQAFGNAKLRGGTTDERSGPELGHRSSSVPSPETFVELEKFNRYEARALSRRKFAFRQFLAIVSRER